MAENQEDRLHEELTEEASPYRIEEFRRRGIVSQSREMAGLIGLVGTGLTLYFFLPEMKLNLMAFMNEVFLSPARIMAQLKQMDSGEVFMTLLGRTLMILGVVALPVCLGGFFAGLAGSFVQVGSIFSWEPVSPNLEKIDPLKGLKKIFSFKQLIEGLRVLLKILVLGASFWFLVRGELLHSPFEAGKDLYGTLSTFQSAGTRFFLLLLLPLLVFGVADWGMQRWQFNKSIRMTKQEAKQEQKEREGDPQIKARIRTVQRDLARRRMMQAVRKASVVITNPTHIAIALRYDKKNMKAPKVIAKGADLIAQKIKEIASEAGIPMVENVHLARTLFKTVKLGQVIPRALYQAVAEVLAYVYKLKGQVN